MALGFCLGPVFSWDAQSRRRFLLRAGIVATIAFLVVRVINVYGDPSRWAWQSSATLTVLSFLNTTKYSPSLSFRCSILCCTSSPPMRRSKNPVRVRL
jgi:uncharacterized membrane protein